jgi:hypothetical protein
MSQQIDLSGWGSGQYCLLAGVDANESGTIKWQLWITKYGERMIDWCQAMGLGFITFMGGDVWVHNKADQTRCNLFGEKKDCVVGAVSNENANTIKLYDSLGVHSDGQWEVYNITIPATLNSPNGMQSRIPSQRFKRRDGVWRAEFLRNMMSTSDTASVIEALSGEPLRGYTIYMKLRNTSDGQVKLFKLDVNQTASRV